MRVSESSTERLLNGGSSPPGHQAFPQQHNPPPGPDSCQHGRHHRRHPPETARLWGEEGQLWPGTLSAVHTRQWWDMAESRPIHPSSTNMLYTLTNPHHVNPLHKVHNNCSLFLVIKNCTLLPSSNLHPLALLQHG